MWLSDSDWRPIERSKFYDVSIPAFEDPPWSGDSNTYLNEASWRPGTCEGLIVGGSTSNMGLLARFSLSEHP